MSTPARTVANRRNALRLAVFEFADRVSAFYARAATKQHADDEDRRGFAKFATEWERRRGRPLG